jgi:excisionase family DNA binding protein
MPLDERLLLKGDEVAQLLGIGRSKAFEMMAAGHLPVIRMGRSVRVPREALYGWIRDRTAPAIEDDDGAFLVTVGRRVA